MLDRTQGARSYRGMFAGTMSAKATLAVIGPLSPEEIAAAAAAILLPLLITWLVMRGKLKRLQHESGTALEQLRAESGAALQAEQAKAAALAADNAKANAEATANFADLQQRFNTHRDVAERRANDASQQRSRNRPRRRAGPGEGSGAGRRSHECPCRRL